MKKILTALIFSFAILSTFSATPVQAAPGTFTCSYVSQAGYCQLGTSNCSTGYAPDLSLCQAMSNNASLCNGTATSPLACILVGPTAPPTVNKYTCAVNRGANPPVCYQAGNTCNTGSGPGTQCQTTAIGNCESVTYDCVAGAKCGGVGGNCCPGQTCTNQFSYCDMNGGGICKACGTDGSACCPNPGSQCQTGVCNSSGMCTAAPVVGGTGVTAFQGTCAGGTAAIDTAIGCVPIGDINSFAAFFFKWGLGIAGGIGFLFLIYASFQVMTSQGDPKRLQTGKELLMSAVSGIILLAFSVLVLKVLGVNILGIF